MPDTKVTGLPLAATPLPEDRDVWVEVVYRTTAGTAGSEDNFKAPLRTLQRRRFQRSSRLETDFFSVTGEGIFSNNSSGTGSGATAITSSIGGAGVVQHSTGTTATGYSRGLWPTTNPASNNTVVLGNGQLIYETRVRLSAPSDATDTYRAVLGLGESGVTDTDAVAFVHDGTSSNWRAMCLSNGSATYADTGIAALAAAWVDLTIVVNAAATEVRYLIDNALVATITTNIPVGDTRATGIVHCIGKSAGTTARLLLVDYVSLEIDFPNGRP